MNTRIIITLCTIGVVLIMWLTFFWFLYNYAEEIRGNPISFAARKLEIDCSCTSKNIPGAFLYVNSSGYVSYDYPSKEITDKIINTSNWEVYNITE